MVKRVESITELGRSVQASFGAGVKICPVLSECREMGRGLVYGDLNKAVRTGGLLAFYALPVGGGVGNAHIKVPMKASA